MRSSPLLLLVAAACGSSSGSSFDRPRAMWRIEPKSCALTLEVYPGLRRATRARIGGAELEIRDVGGVQVPAALVGHAETLAIEIDGEPITVAVPPRQRRLRPPIDAHPLSKADWTATVQVRAGGDKQSYDWGDTADAEGRLRLALPCDTTAGRSADGEVRTDGPIPVLVVDPAAAGAITDLGRHPHAALSAEVDLDGGGKATLTLTASPRAAYLVGLLREIAGRPLPWAAEYHEGAPGKAVIVFDQTIDDQLPAEVRLAEVGLVAVVDTHKVRVGNCGVYQSLQGGQATVVDRHRTDARVTVYEARSGRTLAGKSFRGAAIACPTVVSAQAYGGATFAQDPVGPPPRGAVRTWVARLARGR